MKTEKIRRIGIKFDWHGYRKEEAHILIAGNDTTTPSTPGSDERRHGGELSVSFWSRLGVRLCILGLLVLAVYANTLKNGFVYDDEDQILRNPAIRSWQNVPRLFTQDVWGFRKIGSQRPTNYYRPLQMVGYLVEYRLFGPKPASFHAVNIGFHLLATFAAFAVLRKLLNSSDAAFFGSLLFAVHPIHTEAVDWVSALPELLCGVFFFLALLCLFVAEDTRRSRLLWMLLSAALTFLALLTKEMAFTLPLLVLLYILLNRSERGNLTRKIGLSILPFSLAFVVYLSLRTHALGGLTHVQYPMSLTAFQFFLSDVALVGGYCWKLLAPVRLNAFYVFEPARSPLEWRFLASAAMLAALGLVFWRLRSRRPQAAFLLASTVLTMLPVLYIGGVGENVFAERYLYIPSLGFCGLWGLGFEMGAKRLKRFGTPLTLGSLALVILIYSWQTVHRNRDWRDNFTLYYDTVAKSPTSSPMHNALAREYVHRGDFQAARLQYQQALLVRKENFYSSPLTLYRSLVGMGAIELHAGDLQEAARWVSQALALLPDQPLAYNDFGTVLMQQGRVEKAIEYFQRAVQLGPDSEVYCFNLGLAFLRAGRYAQAREQLEHSLQIYPDDPNTWLELGIAQLNLGNLAEAEQSFQRSLDLNPTSKGVHRYLGALYYDQGRFQDSVREFERAVELAPEDTESAEGLKRAVEKAVPR